MSNHGYGIKTKKQTLTIADGQTVKVGSAMTNLNGLLRGVVVVVPDLTASHTLTVAVKDSDGYTIYTKTGIAESTTSLNFTDANNQMLQLPLPDNSTVTVTASGTESPAVDIIVKLYVDQG